MNNYNKTGSDTGVYFDQGIKWYSHTDIKSKHWHRTIQRSQSMFIPVETSSILRDAGETCFHVYCVLCVIIYVHSCWSFRFISVSRSLASITFKWWFPRTIFAGKHFWHSIQASLIWHIMHWIGDNDSTIFEGKLFKYLEREN